MLGDAFMLVLFAHHETGNILEEYQRDHSLGAYLYEIGTFLCALTEQDTIV